MTPSSRRWVSRLAALLVVASSAFVPSDGARAEPPRSDTDFVVREVTLRAGRAPLDEARSAHLLAVIDTNGIALSRMAAQRAERGDVRWLAETMRDGYSAAQRRIRSWTAANRVVPLASAESAQVAEHAKELLSRLETAERGDFDRAYVSAEIGLHTQTLRLLDERILPGAHRISFRRIAEHIRAVAMDQLDMARALEPTLD